MFRLSARICCALGALLLAASGVRAEMRLAIITVFDDVNDTTSIQNQVNEIAGLRYNAIAVHARYRGDATYVPNKTNSAFPNNEPRAGAAGSMDVLQEFTTRGHAAGLKVFAYVNAYLVTDGTNTDARPNHIINTNPSWVTYAYNGGSPVVQTTTHNGEGKWLDPAIPAAQDRVASICGDIMMNYDCDGIVLDRIRYPQATIPRSSRDFGYHPTAIANFRAQYGGSGTPNPDDANWIAFRQAQIGATVEKVYDTITAIDPGHILLAYPIGRYNDAINYCYQKWPDWMSAGNIDGCLPQIYSTSNSTFSTRCDQNLAPYAGPRLLGVATMAYEAGIDVDGQIGIANAKGFDGISPYRHGSMRGLGYFADLANVWTTTAAWPSMPWKYAPVIVDNSDATFTASTNWWTTTTTPGYYGANYRTRGTAAVSDSALWRATLPATASYKVYARWTAGANRPAAAPFVVYHAGGSTTVSANQQQNNGTWVLLGTFNMAAGLADRVRLSCWTTTGYYAVADAVMFEMQ